GTALKVSGISQPFLAALLVLTGAFQGANNTKFPMYLTGIGMWAVRTLLVYLLGIQLGWGLLGVWLAIGIDIAFRAVLLTVQFVRGEGLTGKKDGDYECRPQTRKEIMSGCVNNY